MWSKLRTFVVVTLVTVLIWVWADAETQRDDLLHVESGGARSAAVEETEFILDKLQVLVALPSGPAGTPKLGKVFAESDHMLRVTIAGPRAVIDRIKAADPTLRLAAVVALDDRDLSANAVEKTTSLLPGGLSLHFVGPAPTVRVIIER